MKIYYFIIGKNTLLNNCFKNYVWKDSALKYFLELLQI